LRPGIDARAGAIAEPVAHRLRQVPHEPVVIFQLIAFDPHNRTIAGYAD
jgi:hypothetical protein